MKIEREIKFPIGRLRYNGIIDLNGLFKITRDWLVSNKWRFYEKTLKHKIYPEGYKKEITWIAYKDPTEYVRFHTTLEFLIREINEVEVVRAGVKKKLQQCIFQVEISGKVELDKEGRFKDVLGSTVLKTLQDFYHNYIIKEDILFVWVDQLTYMLLRVHRVLKEYMEMEAKTNAAEFRWLSR